MKNLENEFRKLLVDWEKVNLINFDRNNFNIKKMYKILNNVKYFQRQDYRNKELKDTSEAMNRLNEFLTSTMGWIHCNPSNHEIVQLSDEAFVFPEKKRDDIKILNTKIGMKTFLESLITEGREGEVVSVIGRKGEGKTYTQNYLLNHYTSFFTKSGYTWFRVDLTKVLRYQRVYGTWMSIEKYLYAQITYVYFRYSKQMRNSLGVDSVLEYITLNEIKTKIEQRVKNENIDSDLNYIREVCIKQYKGKDGLNKPFNSPIVKEIAQSIIQLLKEKGYGYFLFIDGLDNVDYIYDENINRWISQVYNGEISKELQPARYILTCRQETVIYIESYLRNKQHGKWGNAKGEEFTIEALSHKDILNKFLPSILKKELDTEFPAIVKKMKKSKIDKVLLENTSENILKDFYRFGMNFDKYLAIAITERHRETFSIESKEILDVIYNGSLRDILYDIKYAYMYIHYYLQGESERRRTSMSSVTEYLDSNRKRRSYIVLSSLPRNGNIYYNDINVFEPPYMLLHSLNLFSLVDLRKDMVYEAKDMLLSVIILNFLNEKGTKFSDEILDYCKLEGFTNKEVIKNIELKLLEHGLTQIKLEGAEEENYQRLPREITPRGQYSLTAIEDMNIIHSFSYLMYFPQKFIGEGIVKAHKNDLSDYSSAQVVNVLSVLKLLQIYQRTTQSKVFDIFNENIKVQLINFIESMRDSEVEETIKTFQDFMNSYGDISVMACIYTEDELFEMYENGKMNRAEFKRQLKECGYL